MEIEKIRTGGLAGFFYDSAPLLGFELCQPRVVVSGTI